MVTLADAIIEEDINTVRELVFAGGLNQLDEYGFTPLIEAAIADNIEIAKILINAYANVNLQDSTGNTALHWAAENNNLAFCQLLFERGADPNSTNFAGQPAMTMPMLRRQSELRKLFLKAGADLTFVEDYINTKLLGHMFELVGTASIIDPKNQFVEVDFEGFFLEVTLGLIADALEQFQNHYASRKVRRYKEIAQIIADVLQRAAQLIKYQQYRVNINKYKKEIDSLLNYEPLVIPVGYEGHAITFVKLGNMLVKCDRREDSRLFDNVYFYHVGRPDLFNKDFIKHMMYEKQTSEFINEELPQILALEPVTELKVAAQISGNCSWANVEACIPTLFFLLSSRQPDFQENIPHYKTLALNFFKEWREWNKERALRFCIQSFNQGDTVRKATKAEILAAILFQTCNNTEMMNQDRIELILNILLQPQYEYILKNYVKSYSFESVGDEGKDFLRLLRSYGYSPR